MQNQKELLSVKEAATYLNISHFTLRNWVCQRKVPFVKLGKRLLFHPRDLDVFIQTNKVLPSLQRAVGA